jgi:hypothetical protein
MSGSIGAPRSRTGASEAVGLIDYLPCQVTDRAVVTLPYLVADGTSPLIPMGLLGLEIPREEVAAVDEILVLSPPTHIDGITVGFRIIVSNAISRTFELDDSARSLCGMGLEMILVGDSNALVPIEDALPRHELVPSGNLWGLDYTNDHLRLHLRPPSAYHHNIMVLEPEVK